MLDGHFGELFSHTVTVGQFTVPTFTTLFTLVDHEAAFFSAFRCTNIAVVAFNPFWIVRLRNDPAINKTNNIPIMTKPHDHWVICNNKKGIFEGRLSNSNVSFYELFFKNATHYQRCLINNFFFLE